MNILKKAVSMILALSMCLSFALAEGTVISFTDAHGNILELDATLRAYTGCTLLGANGAARGGETNLGDLWTDALRWFAVSGTIGEYFDEDDVTAGNTFVDAGADHIVALWNGGNLRADIAEGIFGAEELAQVLPYPNKVAVVYLTGAQLLEALEAASQALPLTEGSEAACASFMQVSGIVYTVDTSVAYDAGEAYGEHWFRAASLGRVTIEEVNGLPFDPEAVYAVITSNANFNGMDSSYVFREAQEADPKSTVTTAVVRDVVWMYIGSELDSVIGDNYSESQGRITVR
ncbi:MAG: 5'-nucleotidase C-terminal domain-containing protein [Clostridia bacterium]|nr:5'-nucleotidase C-terminal domain-containing protein [Clostridia bacterium]